MMTIKKLLRPQILFPVVILLLLAIALTLFAVLKPKSNFRATKVDEPGAALASWSILTESDFYHDLSVAFYAEIDAEPQYYSVVVPDHEDHSATVTVYQAKVNAMLAQPRKFEPITSERILVHGMHSAFTDAGVTGNGAYVFMLVDARDYPDFEPTETRSLSFYNDYVKTLGYAMFTPFASAFPVDLSADTPRVKTDLLPEYLRGEGEYTTLEELQDILAAGRAKYGMSEYSETPA